MVLLSSPCGRALSYFFLQQPQALSSTSPHIFFVCFLLFSFLLLGSLARSQHVCVGGCFACIPVHTIRGSRRSCFASKTLELCRDVKKEKKEPIDSKLKIQKFGGKIRRKRIQNITNRDSTNFRHQAALPCLPSRVLFRLFTSRHNSSAFDAKHDRRDPFIGLVDKVFIIF